jgi:hypothetical protein
MENLIVNPYLSYVFYCLKCFTDFFRIDYSIAQIQILIGFVLFSVLLNVYVFFFYKRILPYFRRFVFRLYRFWIRFIQIFFKFIFILPFHTIDSIFFYLKRLECLFLGNKNIGNIIDKNRIIITWNGSVVSILSRTFFLKLFNYLVSSKGYHPDFVNFQSQLQNCYFSEEHYVEVSKLYSDVNNLFFLLDYIDEIKNLDGYALEDHSLSFLYSWEMDKFSSDIRRYLYRGYFRQFFCDYYNDPLRWLFKVFPTRLLFFKFLFSFFSVFFMIFSLLFLNRFFFYCIVFIFFILNFIFIGRSRNMHVILMKRYIQISFILMCFPFLYGFTGFFFFFLHFCYLFYNIIYYRYFQ